MIKFLILTLLVFCCVSKLNAQHMSGTIFDDVDNTPLSGTIISNMRTGNSSIADKTGMYRIHAKYGDSINVELIGFKKIVFVVKEAGKDEFVRNVYLSPDYSTLDEFVVSQLSPYQRDSLARKNLYNQALERPWVSGGAVVFSPMTAIGQMVSKKAKQRRRFQQNYGNWEAQKYIESRYTKELVASIVPLNGDSLAYFMNAYPIAADFARAATEVELAMWIRYNYFEWEKQPKIQKIDDIEIKE